MATRYRYARMLTVGLGQQASDCVDAAVAKTELSISNYVRKALRAQFERDGIKPPSPRPARKHERQSEQAAVA